ncbi:unnamed protein product [Rangifer tarandus platyrhynchus]|uniref:Uncharacterized protein n=2 Tax=Rangifer tarandus platyrhynchus TaxID=3082113 RepID=A0ABN8ZEJ4_RANTA|nr:unnamed protein product [Rangifer tarandus platyrhynchus]CAI9707705.1 unnamed protein product [Rangifer tarandus platyrhynchus]
MDFTLCSDTIQGPGLVQRAQARCALTSDSGSAALTVQAPPSMVFASISSVSRPKRLASAWPSSRLSLPSPPFCRSPPGDPQAPLPRALTQDGPLNAGEEHPPTPSTGGPPPRPHAELLGLQISGPMSPNSQLLARSPGDLPAPGNWRPNTKHRGCSETRGLGSMRQ